MGCCGRPDAPSGTRVYPPNNLSNGSAVSFELINSDGTTQTFGSRLEADAENARNGYKGVVRTVA